ncbi:MAG TPA: Z1 domain-containing protein [Thermoanaerobaculia bacterium]|nr:Z1 domain-containing protein [Thermoanaerobaculia bacterium]
MPTTGDRPGMLLGRIQSGKTRAFIGIIAKAFDEGIDFAIVLTKGTNPLSEQTIKRIKSDFKEAIDDEEVLVFDIMTLKKNLTRFHLQKKWIIVAKKEKNNLKRVFHALQEHYPDLQKKRLLIIDDEADFATLTYRKNRDTDEIEPGKIAGWVDSLRHASAVTHFLQVTATPYSLYLQPNDGEESRLFHPVRPAFTEILPIYPGYAGGDFFFGDVDDEASLAHFVYEEVPLDERDALKKSDRRGFRIEEALGHKKIAVLRRALVNFILGGCIRRWQQETGGGKRERYSFIVHTESARASHSWQDRIVRAVVEQLVQAAAKSSPEFEELLGESYADLERSLMLTGTPVPSAEVVTRIVRDALVNEYVVVTVVNSNNDVKNLLDEEGQLELLAPLNIFIGGSILDRGLTIRNLIGFYYGRNPQQFQQDTVLQHARLYGNRPPADLAVTRFYTTSHIHQVMRKIHDFDTTLRQAIEKGSQKRGIYFIRRDDRGQIIPCSPNKIMASDIVTVRAHKQLRPFGFQTRYKSYVSKDMIELDRVIAAAQEGHALDEPVLVDVAVGTDILSRIEATLEFEDPDYQWDFNAHAATLEFLSEECEDPAKKGRLWLLVRRDRNLSRYRVGEGRFSNAPLSYQERPVIERTATDLPLLALVRENGSEADGWRGTPFWWPIITPGATTPTTVFASKTRGDE